MQWSNFYLSNTPTYQFLISLYKHFERDRKTFKLRPIGDHGSHIEHEANLQIQYLIHRTQQMQPLNLYPLNTPMQQI